MKTLHFNYGYFDSDPVKDLEYRLNLGIVDFMFIKKEDSSVRNARGTLNMLLDCIDWSAIPMDLITPPSHVRTYFDLDKNKWRCFIKDNLIWYSEDVEVDL